MTPEQLKASILQYAIQGKLVEQKPEEGLADALLEEIRKEKEQLIADGKAKSSKKLAPISDIEKPFDIPDSWKWVYLQDVSTINGGYAFKSTDYTTEGTRVIRISDFNEEGFVDNKIVRHPYKEEFEPFLLNEKDILLCMTGGTVGKSYFVRSVNEPMMTNQRVATIKILGSIQEYINYVILSPITQNVIQASKTSTNDNISMDTINSFLIPLPPFNEAKRIVVKIEEMLPFVDRYAASYEKLEQFNAKFPEDMKKSILQYAIMGKLVEQRPEEGTAEELYKRIVDDREEKIKNKQIKRDKRANLDDIPKEMPFDIPDNWKWVTLGSILLKLTDGTHKTPKYTESGVKFVSVKDMSSGVLSLDNTKYISADEHIELFSRCDPQKGDMLLSKVGTTGVPAIVDTEEPFSLFVSVSLLKYNHKFIDEKFLYYLLQSPLVQDQANENTRGVGNKNWVLDAIGKTLIVLPPIEEQKRIVAKLEEILPYCDQLIK